MAGTPPPPGETPRGSVPPTGGDFATVRPQADNDKLIGALCYIFWFLVPIIILVTDMKNSRFAKIHAYQGLVFGAAGIVFYIVYGIFWTVLTAVAWFLACILWVGFFVPFVAGLYFAYLVYSRDRVELPLVSDATKAMFKDI